MKRRLAIALLALLVATTGAAACARGVQACAAMRAATPDCCTNGVLAAADCCCPARGTQAATFLPTSESAKATGLDPSTMAMPVVLAPPGARSLSALVLRHPVRVFAPPDTPLSRRTSLLL